MFKLNKVKIFQCLLLAILVITPFFNGSKGPVAVFILETAILLMFSFFIVFFDIRKTSADKPIFLFSLFFIVSVASTVYFNNSLNTAVLAVSYALLFYLAVSVRDVPMKNYIHLGIFAVSLIVSLIVVVQILLEKIPTATFPNKNMAAGYISYGAVLAFAHIFLEKYPARIKSILIFCLVLFVAAIIMTGSRGGIIALLFGMAFIIHIKYRKWGLLAFFIILLSLFIIIPKNKIADMVKISGGDAYSLARVKIWKSALNIIKEKPLTGTGPGNFGLLFFKHKFEGNTSIARYGKITRFAHNEFLNVASECGIFCLIFFVWLWAVILRNCNKSPISSAVLIAVVSHSFFDLTFHLPAIVVMTVLLSADILSSDAANRGFYKFKKKYFIVLPVTFAMLNAFVFIVKPFDAEKYKIIADKFVEKDPILALSMYQKAVRLSPNNYEYRQSAGELLYINGDKENARKSLEKSLELNPKNPFAYKSLGQYYFNDEKYKIAEYYFLKALNAEPNYLWARYSMAKTYENLNEIGMAFVEYADIIEIKDKFKSVVILSSYEKSLLSIDMSAVYNSIGFLKLSLKETTKAIEMFNKALKINPANARIQSNIASAYCITGDYNNALTHAKLAVDYEKDEPLHIKNMILIYEKMGNAKEAAKLKNDMEALKKIKAKVNETK